MIFCVNYVHRIREKAVRKLTKFHLKINCFLVCIIHYREKQEGGGGGRREGGIAQLMKNAGKKNIFKTGYLRRRDGRGESSGSWVFSSFTLVLC